MSTCGLCGCVLYMCSRYLICYYMCAERYLKEMELFYPLAVSVYSSEVVVHIKKYICSSWAHAYYSSTWLIFSSPFSNPCCSGLRLNEVARVRERRETCATTATGHIRTATTMNDHAKAITKQRWVLTSIKYLLSHSYNLQNKLALFFEVNYSVL